MNPDVSDDYFDTASTGDGVLVRMSDNVAATLTHHVERLARFLETGAVDAEPGGLFRRRTTSEDVARRMFPDAYPDRAESDAFRARHTAALGDSAAVRRFIHRCSTGSQHVLPREEADEWIGVLGMVRFVAFPRTGVRGDAPELVWFNWAQESLVAALHPDWFSARP
ncbi:DUF2017 family protein [Actinokineospora sp. UTMC 2448]|uniref:DUF2017 family protein n=1 Tax=Actinokineospora sp. UTMC 2448 TaxID=2268449 RepID=UPI0021640F62|nr:DUF2017 family protein [Actinokineospora sp. UTMC 2448]UVS78889.1 hypothetical protein Actkin_02626 [Actinokineospora sp. UTMC 2448]